MTAVGAGVAKMGFGFDPTAEAKKPIVPGFGATSAPPVSKPAYNGNSGFGSTYSAPPVDDGGEAAKRFSSAKGISSDQYFGRGNYDEAER